MRRRAQPRRLGRLAHDAKVEDLIYERADLRPEPVLLNPQRINITSSQAVQEHSAKLLPRLGGAPRDALVACGKSRVLSNGLLGRPGFAANYGLFSATAPYRSATGAYRLWQPLSFAHNLDHWDYSQLLRLVRRRPGTPLPSYDEPLRVFELVRASTPPVRRGVSGHVPASYGSREDRLPAAVAGLTEEGRGCRRLP